MNFKFIKTPLSFIASLLQKLNYVLEGIVTARPYTLNWKKVIKEYKEDTGIDYYNFATIYTFNWHNERGLGSEYESKKRMHKEIVEGLKARKV